MWRCGIKLTQYLRFPSSKQPRGMVTPGSLPQSTASAATLCSPHCQTMTRFGRSTITSSPTCAALQQLEHSRVMGSLPSRGLKEDKGNEQASKSVILQQSWAIIFVTQPLCCMMSANGGRRDTARGRLQHAMVLGMHYTPHLKHVVGSPKHRCISCIACIPDSQCIRTAGQVRDPVFGAPELHPCWELLIGLVIRVARDWPLLGDCWDSIFVGGTVCPKLGR